MIRKLSVPAVILGGLLPDFDFVFILFPFFNNVHRIVTHNLVFIISVSILFPFIIRNNKTAVFAGLLVGGLLHLCVDSVMDNNPTNGIGVALLWPFYEGIFSPFNMLKVLENSSGWNEPLKMFRALVPAMLLELPFYLLSVFLLFRRVHSGTSSSQNSPM